MTRTAARRRFLIQVVALATTTNAHARAADEPGPLVTVERDGSAIVVHAQADVPASAALAFATLTDYDHLGDFIPDIATSRTLQRDGGSSLVEQRGRASFGPFAQEFTVKLAIEESPGAWVHARLAGGDFKRFEARYELTALANGTTRVEYRATLEPTAGVPPLVGVPVMRMLIRRQFAALVSEIARRA